MRRLITFCTNDILSHPDKTHQSDVVDTYKQCQLFVWLNGWCVWNMYLDPSYETYPNKHFDIDYLLERQDRRNHNRRNHHSLEPSTLSFQLSGNGRWFPPEIFIQKCLFNSLEYEGLTSPPVLVKVTICTQASKDIQERTFLTASFFNWKCCSIIWSL